VLFGHVTRFETKIVGLLDKVKQLFAFCFAEHVLQL